MGGGDGCRKVLDFRAAFDDMEDGDWLGAMNNHSRWLDLTHHLFESSAKIGPVFPSRTTSVGRYRHRGTNRNAIETKCKVLITGPSNVWNHFDPVGLVERTNGGSAEELVATLTTEPSAVPPNESAASVRVCSVIGRK